MSLSKVTRGDTPNRFNVIIEIPAYAGTVKYEVDKDTQCLTVDRFMKTALQYPANYGYVPDTLCGDGDPLDVLVLTPEPLVPGCVIEARPIGVLHMSDEAGEDAKLLALPTEKACPMYANMQDITDIPELVLDQIKHFFEHYKDLDQGKWVKLDGYGNKAEALTAVEDAVALYKP
ncbi:inorganic diphosphatase [Ostreibacterium oceani]|uniref:Inorganic pyrophosphatase n=1 Tax=Ostreibacterium oceani TaxID=2654998 RepID=A0A6N7ER61_9GAMM|nr:inorganic diphosphatase [Ostreibacterium oceani]MPV85354.1 inorganic diphosphatase [Ostreibacterium oceani]